MARNRRTGLTAYTERLLQLLAIVVPHIGHADRRHRRKSLRHEQPADGQSRAAVLVIGSERGLCGAYNKTLLEKVGLHLADDLSDFDVEIGALGSRLSRELRQGGIEPTWEKSLSITSLPSYDLAYDLASDWLRRFEAYELDRVDVVYNADLGAGTYASAAVRLIPPVVPAAEEGEPERSENGLAQRLTAAPIVETDPVRLYVRVVEQFTTIALYRYLLEAASTEHSSRYQLMESAAQNADDLVAELMLTVNSARRQAITREMQELAISAGLLNE
jgi:F-type H+-transporting ATPase subunit gamma